MSLGCVFEHPVRIAQFPAKSLWIQHPAINGQPVGLVISWSLVHVPAGRCYRLCAYLSSSCSLNLRWSIPSSTTSRRAASLEGSRFTPEDLHRPGPCLSSFTSFFDRGLAVIGLQPTQSSSPDQATRRLVQPRAATPEDWANDFRGIAPHASLAGGPKTHHGLCVQWMAR